MIRSTDYGILMDKFLALLDKEVKHKSFVVKIQNKLDRYHKRHGHMVVQSDKVTRQAILKANKVFKDQKTDISIGALCWLIHNRHKKEMKPYGFDPQWFEQMNRYFGAQGVIFSTAKVLNAIEEELHNEGAGVSN